MADAADNPGDPPPAKKPRRPGDSMPGTPGDDNVEDLLDQLKSSVAGSAVSSATALFKPEDKQAPGKPPPIKEPTPRQALPVDPPGGEVDAILAQLATKSQKKPASTGTNVSSQAHPAPPSATGALTARATAPPSTLTPAKPQPTLPAPVGTGSGSRARDDSEANPLLPSDASTSDSLSLDAVLQALPGSKVHTTKQIKKPAPKLGLSQEDIDSLIAKHGDAPSEQQAETMISQEDIDALVKQLSAATSKLAATAAIRAGTRAVAAPIAEAASGVARGAAGGHAGAVAIGGTTSLSDVRAAVASALPPVMGRRELDATRWLLGAAVVLLAACAVAMAVMAGTVHRLGVELTKDRERAETAARVADAAVEMKAALALLASQDENENARGVAQLDRIKAAYPMREDDIDLALARHFRAHGRDRLAAERYGALFDRGAHPLSDPGVHLEYAECLADLGDVDAALRRCYALLADERGFRAERDAEGRRRTEADLKRVDEAMARAELLRGRLLADLAAKGAEPAASAVGRAETKRAEHEP